MGGDCDIKGSVSTLLLLQYAALTTLCFFNGSEFLMGSITFKVRR